MGVLTQTPKADSEASANGKPQVPAVSFPRAARRRREPIFSEADVLGAVSVAHNGLEVPANGFLRHLLILVTGTGGNNGAAVVDPAPDAPWNVLSEVTFADVNGAPIIPPLTGYELYLLNKYGGYAWSADPRAVPAFTDVDAEGNFSFLLRIPLEISRRDALGSLPNMNAAETFKVGYTLAPAATVFTVEPDDLPTITVQAWTEVWSAPLPRNAQGAPQATVPPDLGVVQFMSRQIANVNAGEQTVRHTRVGNAIRNLIYVGRTGAGARADTVFPANARLTLDTVPLDQIPPLILRSAMAEAYGYGGTIDAEGGLDTGVWVWTFADDLDGHPGEEMRDAWLPTTAASRLELQGSFGAAGTLTILTNDVGRPTGA